MGRAAAHQDQADSYRMPLYRPPHQHDLMEIFEEVISGITTQAETIIIGDINIDVMPSTNSSAVNNYNVCPVFNRF